ncbi:tail fiber domain-containing protein [Erwinia sp. QL-Z3]|uniref:tail fiber domain-containing protein n=1 Tax=Erwinia sp. QL-Z3 TaxID=2547962 RepID=UPI001070FB0E|nr:tail fiber domain-containing protein [Erwinia sp. QL-Z3]QBR52648.1 tail fiber domain-containing protein [Erwinia sp. QL-Z3]
MPAGTISLTNNSTTITGTGTSFTTELKVNDFVTATVGGVLYTLGVAAIASNTSLTVIQKYDGPTTSGLSWNPVPYGTMAAITAQLAAQVTYAIRGMNLDKNNWQQIFTGTGNVTVTLPDGTSWTGPAWNGIATAITNKADLVSGAVAITQGGTGAKTKADAWTALATYGTTAGTAAQGNDSRITGALQRTGGTMTSQIFSSVVGAPAIIKTAPGAQSGINYLGQASLNNNQYMTIDVTGTAQNIFTRIVTWNTNPKVFGFYDNGNGTCDGSWISGSDERHKSNIKLVPKSLQAVLSWRGCTYDKKDGMSEVGLIAQDVEKSCPTAVMNTGLREFTDGTVIEDFKSLNVAGVAAAYHTEAIKALFSLVELALVDPEKALSSIDDIKAALSKGEATS